MKGRKDVQGVVFDVPEYKFERFMDVYKHLAETDSRVDFSIAKCTELPELSEDFDLKIGEYLDVINDFQTPIINGDVSYNMAVRIFYLL